MCLLSGRRTTSTGWCSTTRRHGINLRGRLSRPQSSSLGRRRCSSGWGRHRRGGPDERRRLAAVATRGSSASSLSPTPTTSSGSRRRSRRRRALLRSSGVRRWGGTGSVPTLEYIRSPLTLPLTGLMVSPPSLISAEGRAVRVRPATSSRRSRSCATSYRTRRRRRSRRR